MLQRYKTQGCADALRRFGFEKEAMELGPAGLPHEAVHLGPAGVPHAEAPAAAVAAPSLMDKARSFGADQWGAVKNLAGNLRTGLGGAGSPEAGAAARQMAIGNLKTLAPSLAAGGALYMLHRHSQAQREQEARQRAMMGYPAA